MEKTIIFLVLLLIFIFIEKCYGFLFESFIDTEYDYYYNGDVIIDSRKQKISVGIGDNINSKYNLNIGGTLYVRDKLCYGNTCLDARMLKLLNDVPHFEPNKLCLRTKDNEKVCIEEKHLQLLTGQRSLRLKSNLVDSRTNTKNPRYFRRHNYYAHPNHDDNDDYKPPHCGPGTVYSPHNTCSHSTSGKGNFRGYVANPIMDNFDADRECFHLSRGIKWQEDMANSNKFAIELNPDTQSRKIYFPENVHRNFTSKPFNYKCYPST